MKKSIARLYGFFFFDQFMIVIALWVPYLATKGIGMRQFMELQADHLTMGIAPQHELGRRWGAPL